MLGFSVAIIGLIVLVMAMLLPALQRPQTQLKTDQNAERRAIFKAQFEEIAQDQVRGTLNDEQYQIAKTELERRMLNEVGTDLGAQRIVSAPDMRLAYVLALLIPLAALGVYHKIGSPVHVFNPEATVARSESAHDNSVMSADFETLLNQLKAKLEQEPNNADGWALLARSYVQLGRHAEAVTAYGQAANLIQDDPSLLADYADALGVVNGGSLVGKPEAMINQALKLDPHHDKALMLAGTVAYDKKDYTNAISLWERLKKVLSPQSELLPDVNAALAETYSLAGIKPPVIQSQEEVNKPFAVSSASINGAVSMAPELANKVSPTDTVFIFARPAKGKTMPLAIEKISARELPYNFMLDDSKALIPNHKLSQASEVILVARVSKTGDATSNPGDLEGVSAPVKPNGTTVNIEIKNIVE